MQWNSSTIILDPLVAVGPGEIVVGVQAPPQGRSEVAPGRDADHHRRRYAVSDGANRRDTGAGVREVPGNRHREPLEAAGLVDFWAPVLRCLGRRRWIVRPSEMRAASAHAFWRVSTSRRLAETRTKYARRRWANGVVPLCCGEREAVSVVWAGRS